MKMQETCGSSKSHKNAQNFEIFPGKNLSFVDVESVPSLLPCELGRPPERMEGRTGPFRIEPGEGKEKYKSSGTWKELNMDMSFLAAKVKRETEFRVRWEIQHTFTSTFVTHWSRGCVGEKIHKCHSQAGAYGAWELLGPLTCLLPWW